jgi:hypothetical protein
LKKVKNHKKYKKTTKFKLHNVLSSKPNYFNMKNISYFLICLSIFLAACDSKKSPEPDIPASRLTPAAIPFKRVPNDTASLMIRKYFSQPPMADTSYREVPRLLRLDAETVKSFTAGNKEGEVVQVNFMIAAYLDNRPFLLKNTMLLQIGRQKEKRIVYEYYDLRESKTTFAGGSTLCPPPLDCVPPSD